MDLPSHLENARDCKAHRHDRHFRYKLRKPVRLNTEAGNSSSFQIKVFQKNSPSFVKTMNIGRTQIIIKNKFIRYEFNDYKILAF